MASTNVSRPRSISASIWSPPPRDAQLIPPLHPLPTVLVPVDHARHTGEDVKTRNECMILGNELRKCLVDPLPVSAHLTAIFDSCHSGTLLDLDHYLCNNIYHPWKNPGRRRYKTLWQHVRRRDGRGEFTLRARAAAAGKVPRVRRLTLWAHRDDERGCTGYQKEARECG